jgi:hypothetical protein
MQQITRFFKSMNDCHYHLPRFKAAVNYTLKTPRTYRSEAFFFSVVANKNVRRLVNLRHILNSIQKSTTKLSYINELVASILQHPTNCKFQFTGICFSPQLLI